MNKIPETQLEPTQLKYLAAQRQLYSDAKFIQAFQAGINVFGPPILAVLVGYCSMHPVYAACCGIIVTFLNILWFTPRQQSLKKKASGIQELFDCNVLQLQWRELKAGSQLEIETIEKYDLKYKRKKHDHSELENWYPKNVGKLPIHLGRVLCQRSSCWWDAELRQRYGNLVIWILGILTVLILFFGLGGGFTLEEFILAVALPFIPAFVLGIRQYKEYTESATRLGQLRKYAEGIWDKGLGGVSPEELTHNSRDLQDEIYNHRRTSPLIFNRLYKRYRKEMEEQMNGAVDKLIEDALKCLEK
jgi:hypothetical protein